MYAGLSDQEDWIAQSAEAREVDCAALMLGVEV